VLRSLLFLKDLGEAVGKGQVDGSVSFYALVAESPSTNPRGGGDWTRIALPPLDDRAVNVYVIGVIQSADAINVLGMEYWDDKDADGAVTRAYSRLATWESTDAEHWVRVRKDIMLDPQAAEVTGLCRVGAPGQLLLVGDVTGPGVPAHGVAWMVNGVQATIVFEGPAFSTLDAVVAVPTGCLVIESDRTADDPPLHSWLVGSDGEWVAGEVGDPGLPSVDTASLVSGRVIVAHHDARSDDETLATVDVKGRGWSSAWGFPAPSWVRTMLGLGSTTLAAGCTTGDRGRAAEVWSSEDEGATWTAVIAAPRDGCFYALGESADSLWAVGLTSDGDNLSAMIYRSDDGRGWQDMGDDSVDGLELHAIGTLNGHTVLAGHSVGQSSGAEVLVSR
jgi:hypothetical protein